jgi:hypothetical protein
MNQKHTTMVRVDEITAVFTIKDIDVWNRGGNDELSATGLVSLYFGISKLTAMQYTEFPIDPEEAEDLARGLFLGTFWPVYNGVDLYVNPKKVRMATIIGIPDGNVIPEKYNILMEIEDYNHIFMWNQGVSLEEAKTRLMIMK